MEKQNFNLAKFIFAVLFIFSHVVQAHEIVFSQTNGRLEVKVPVVNDQGAPSVVAQKVKGNFFFATGKAAQNLAQAQQRPAPPEPALVSLDQLLLLKWNRNQQTVAAIYPIYAHSKLKVTAVHALKDTFSNSVVPQKWYGFISKDTNEILDVAFAAEDSDLDILDFIQSTVPVRIDNGLQIYHLNLIEGTEDATMAKSVLSEVRAVSSKFFYFTNDQYSTVGPQSSGAVIYDRVGRAVGMVSCLAKVNTTGPVQNLIKAVSFDYLRQAQLIELTPELILQYKNSCQSYDGKKGGGD